MTTKEEVLRLAKDAGFRIDCADIIEFNVDWDGCAMEITDEITKLIDLAKQAECERIIKLLEGCAAHWQAINPILHKAIRIREIKG